MYVASESDSTCVCDKSWAGGRRGAQGPLRIKWGHRCSRPPTYNSTISQVPNNCCSMYQTIVPWTSSMWQAAAWAKDQPASRTFNCAAHLLPARPTTLLLLYCLFLLLQVLFLYQSTDVPGVTRPPITFAAAQFLYLLPIQGHAPGGGRYFVSQTPPKTWLEKTLAFECDTWERWHVSRDMSANSRASLNLAPLSRQIPIPTLISPAMDGFLTTLASAARIWPAGSGL